MKNLSTICLLLTLSGCYATQSGNYKEPTIPSCQSYTLDGWMLYSSSIIHETEAATFTIVGEKVKSATGKMQYLVKERTMFDYQNSDWIKCGLSYE